MVKVHLNVVVSDIGRHGNDGGAVKLSDQVTSRHPIQIRHDDIHQDHVILDALLNLLHSFKTVKLEESAGFPLCPSITYRSIDFAAERIKKFATNLSTSRIILDQ